MKGQVFFRESRSKANTERKKKLGTWTYQFDVAKAGGGRRYITKGGFSTKQAAEEALTAIMADYGRTPLGVVEPSKMALADYLRDDWLATRAHLKRSTREGYTQAIDAWIAPHIGDIRLCDLTAAQIIKLYATLRTSGGTTRSGKKGDRTRTLPLSENTVHKAHIVLTGALSYAAITGRLRVNPMTLVPKSDRPKQGKGQPEMKTWTADEAKAFLDASEHDRHCAIYDLDLNTGLRRGELAGLKWVDVDLDGCALSVRRNRVPVNWQVHENTPKSSRPRLVELDPDTVTMLRRHRRRQLEERMAWGEAWTDSGYVFTREDGTPLHPGTIGWHFEKLMRLTNKAIIEKHTAAKLSGPAPVIPVIRLHDLRHTHATLGLAAGIPVKVMSERLGHAKVQITIDLYQHVMPGMGADAAAKIAGLLRRAQ
jgi:integrase